MTNNLSTNISILKNNGNGTFQTKVDYETVKGPRSVFCADLNGDGDLDLSVANSTCNSVSILMNKGDGTFESSVEYGVGRAPNSVFCADLDADGDLDLAVATPYGVSVLLNRTVQDDVKEENTEKDLVYLRLCQNYPNPFNQSTKIEFTLTKSGFVSLNIYDILARKTRTLVSKHLSYGHKSVLWDAKDDAGKDVASGIYFYQLRIGDFSEAKKMLLLK